MVKVGVIAPLQAGLTDFAKGIRNSVQLAVDQANASGRFSVRFAVDARDDFSTPSVGQAAAQSLATDPSVIGDAYQAAGFSEPPSDFGPYAFPRIIGAVQRRGFYRAGVVAEIQAANATGVTPPLNFDSFGDTRNKVITLYRVEAGVFVPRNTVIVP